MTAPLPKTDVYTDFQGLSTLRTQARNDSQEALREVADQFEALFIQMMLKSMRDANLGEGLLDNDQTETYQAMFDKQIAIDLSKGRGIGLADMIVRQLGKSGMAAGATGADDAPGAEGRLHAERPMSSTFGDSAVTSKGKIEATSTWRPATPEAFLRDLWPHAERAADELGATPEALLAQAALETGWGKHMISGTDGRNSFNLFGIKADSRWQGERVVNETVEYRDGVVRKERAHFRAYASVADSFRDYADFLKSNPRYQEALEAASDAPTYTRALEDAGYATDPEYSKKINQILGSNRFREALGEIKEGGFKPLS